MSVNRFFTEDLAKIQAELKKNAAPNASQPLFFELSPLNLEALLSYAACERVFYFSSKDRDFTFLGLGLAKLMKKPDVENFFRQYPEQFVSTDFLFEDTVDSAEYVLHEWSFVCTGEKCHLVIFKHSEARMFSAPALMLDQNTPVDEKEFIPPWSSYEEVPEHDEWFEMMEKANQLFQTELLQKIVLSRRKIFGYNEVLDPLAFFQQLLKKNARAKSFRIYHQPRFGEAFLSITPEKLFTLKGKSFESISLAGSAPRGKTEAEDKELEEFLKVNEKLVREHSLVTEELRAKLGPISEKLSIGDLVTMKLPYIQHRQADIKAELKHEASALDLITLLHPTPAIGGLPWDQARVKLQEIEPFKRGHYAAPVGLLSSSESEMAVGIRSALVEAETITLYGGAGIVKGSDAEEEWIETGTKMNPFLKVVNNE